MSWVIKGVLLYGEGELVDVRIDDGRIEAIGNGLDADETIDAAGMVLLPGLVDLHTHLREPGREDAETVESGTRCTRWPTPTRSPTPRASSSRSGGSGSRPRIAMSLL